MFLYNVGLNCTLNILAKRNWFFKASMNATLNEDSVMAIVLFSLVKSESRPINPQKTCHLGNPNEYERIFLVIYKFICRPECLDESTS